MTDLDPSDRDELVAAYLDDEATPAERAVVEADPELLARVELLRSVAAMVAEPVIPPPLEVRTAHLAAALAVSDTAPNVTSLATRRPSWSNNLTVVASAAAILLVVLLAVPVLLLSGGGDDDVDTAATGGLERSAEADTAADDGGDGAAEAFEAAAEEPSADLATESAEEPAEEPAEEGAVVQSGADDATTARLATARALIAVPVADLDALVNVIRNEMDGADTAPSMAELGLDLACGVVLSDPAITDPVLLVGSGTIGDTAVEYVVTEGADGRVLTVVDTTTCETIGAEPLDP